MSRTVFVQPIFVPDEKRFERNLNSINSFIYYCEKNNVKIDCVFGGWGREDLMLKIIDRLSEKDLPFNIISIQKFSRNYGKAIVVNKLVKAVEEKGVDFEFILTCDSDIMFTETEKDIIERLEGISQVTETIHRKPFGVLGINQKGESHHRPKTFQKVLELIVDNYSEKISWGEPEPELKEVYDCATHIAGGCLFISKSGWDKVGGYRVMGVYAGDDTYLLKDLAENGFNYQLVQSINIYHPPENDTEYYKWKQMTTKKYSGPRKNNIDKIMDETDKFWELRNHE